MHWYLVHTKPRQEKCALTNLERQGYECYLPTIPSERLQQGSIRLSDEPLFPGYLFIRLGQGVSAKSWSPIRSTKGVRRLVSFGAEPAKVDDGLVELLQARGGAADAEQPVRLFSPGQRVQVAAGPFAGIEGIFQMAEGERRVIVLIELLSKTVPVKLAPSVLRSAR
jgi:transcriptional antiterminator RfaH